MSASRQKTNIWKGCKEEGEAKKMNNLTGISIHFFLIVEVAQSMLQRVQQVLSVTKL